MYNKHDIEIYTDGSGHINGFGGWAAYITTPDRTRKDFRMGGASRTSVDRMEFTAFLEGLQGAMEMAQEMPEWRDEGWCPAVLWYSDRESLVNSVLKTYARSNCPDLWDRFAFYEGQLLITPKFVTEEIFAHSAEFREVDLQSSVNYQMIKAYLSGQPFSPKFEAI